MVEDLSPVICDKFGGGVMSVHREEKNTRHMRNMQVITLATEKYLAY